MFLKAREQAIENPVDTIRRIAEERKFSQKLADSVVSSYLIEPEPNRFGVINAFTNAAQRMARFSGSRWNALRERFWKLLCISSFFLHFREALACLFSFLQLSAMQVMAKFTVVLDESGSPRFPATEQDRYFSVGLLVPQWPDDLRDKIFKARKDCPDDRVKRRGFFHASEDVREARRFFVQQLHGNKFYFKMLLADKKAADGFHKVNKPGHFHRVLVREVFNIGVANRCREIDLLVGVQNQTLRSPQIIQHILGYHSTLQILEAISFPYGTTVRSTVESIRMVTPIEEPLMDIVDYLIWAHQRAELKDDQHEYLQLQASMMRSAVGGAHRFPGIWRIFTYSTWSPSDPVLSRKIFPFFDAPEEPRFLERVVEALHAPFDAVQENRMLSVARTLSLKIASGDRTTDTLLDFGEALFEVLDTEAVILHVSEKEFCVLKRGAAICCWLRKKKRHKPPVEGWEKMLEEFFTRLTGQQARIAWE